MRIYKENSEVIFECKGNSYVLTSHPYEPCLYINHDGKIIKTVHNAFEAHLLPERLSDGGSVFAADGRHYDNDSFCEALEAALEYENSECNFTFAAMLSQTEKKCPSDFITDGVLAYGVCVGRFEFFDENVAVYAISDLPHIGASDAFTLYQISPADYKKLVKLSLPNSIPDNPLPEKVAESYWRGFLCGESVYQRRYYFRLRDADKSLFVKMNPKQCTYNFCPQCGRKNNGDKFCRDCGTELLKKRMTIKKVTSTSCKCRFYLESGEVVEASTEFKGGKPGLQEGQYVYNDTMRYLGTGRHLTSDEAEILKKEYIEYSKIADSEFEIDFFEPKQPVLIEKGEYRGVKGYIYEYADGSVVASTFCSECKIADSVEEFKAIPRDKLELMIYSNEMDVAR